MGTEDDHDPKIHCQSAQEEGEDNHLADTRHGSMGLAQILLQVGMEEVLEYHMPAVAQSDSWCCSVEVGEQKVESYVGPEQNCCSTVSITHMGQVSMKASSHDFTGTGNRLTSSSCLTNSGCLFAMCFSTKGTALNSFWHVLHLYLPSSSCLMCCLTALLNSLQGVHVRKLL